MFFIETERLKLIPLTRAQLLLLQESREKMELSMGLTPSNMLVDQIWQDELADAIENWCLPKTLLYPDKWIWYSIWEAVRKDTNTSIGGFGLGYPDENGESITGYSIDRNEQGKGYGTEGLKRICEWGFETPEVKVIWADTGLDNLPSQRILQKAGFTQTGTRDEFAVFKMPRQS
ncbi:GNAT family N-acetyltransferase [Mucilaginibacter gilvus]|uniref:N-acetyltransferase n=1 Tax=Mucilaginibacter gilvus TaxID=2305909 RepID=A0A3S3V150_9SPHI|nr:GNAT family N-acetyltransferase [Mucilaginibacter gilvus]RWY55573.1 N-acetyltransferase [Mucilaginibacter gilvus]